MNIQTNLDPESLNYLLRVGEAPAPDSSGDATTLSAAGFQWLRILGNSSESKSDPRDQNDARERRALIEQRPQLDSFVSGLHDRSSPFALHVSCGAGRVALCAGIWEQHTGQSTTGPLESVLRSTYPGLQAERDAGPSGRRWQRSGVALGVPPTQFRSSSEGLLPIDRLLRALRGHEWSMLVVAIPAPDAYAAALRDSVLNEMRLTEVAQARERSTSPLAENYLAVLRPFASVLTEATAGGLWRTAIYLCGTDDSYPLLASSWKTIFAGSELRAEPSRIWDWPEASDLAANYSLPNRRGNSGPASYRRPFHYQTMLSSSQLAAYAHLPEREHEGYSITQATAFDLMPAEIRDETPTISLGRVTDGNCDDGSRTANSGAQFSVALNDLSRHAFVTGVTGAGKTNTIFTLLRGVAHHEIPFLVLEPAKAEYRRLLNDPQLSRGLRVFTLGDDTTSPMRLNPFEVIPGEGNSIANHLNMLRAVFTAAFGLWSPLPEIIEQALYSVYSECGWNIADNSNSRIRDNEDRARSFPTLSAFCETVDDLVLNLGYEPRTMSDIRAALSTRLNSLRAGGKGRLLDTEFSTNTDALFESNCVLELERMGNDSDRAFMMGLLLIRLSEYRRSTGSSDRLRHLVIIEEAHRLLSRGTSSALPGQPNPGQHAVEAFTNLLAEVRAFGEGVVIADQIPSRLAPEVTKNTNLKIAHRLVAEDDRLIVGATMVATPRQQMSLATLPRGVAAVFCEGEDAPLLVKIDYTKDALDNPDDSEVIGWMRKHGAADAAFRYISCATTCAERTAECDSAQLLRYDDRARVAIERYIESVLELTSAARRLWPEVKSEILSSQHFGRSQAHYIRCAVVATAWGWADRRGGERGWSFSDTTRFATELVPVLLEPLDGNGEDPSASFGLLCDQLHHRASEPYPSCATICGSDPPVCKHRETAERYLSMRADQGRGPLVTGRPTEDWLSCKNAASELIEWPPLSTDDPTFVLITPGARRMALCLGQVSTFRRNARTVDKIEEIENLVAYAVGTTKPPVKRTST